MATQHKKSSYYSFLSATPTIKELTEYVDVSTNWYIVGTMLDLDQKRLRSIEEQTGHTDTHKMIEMFNLWLSTTPTASRRQVLEVLRKRVVGENTLADEYEKYLKEIHEKNSIEEQIQVLQKQSQNKEEEEEYFPHKNDDYHYDMNKPQEIHLPESANIDQLLKLREKKELGSVKFDDREVTLFDVSIKQCQELIIRIEGKHSCIYIIRSAPDIPQFMIPALLRMRSISTILLSYTRLESDVIHSFSDQLSHNQTLVILKIQNHSINDDGVIALAQSLKHNSMLSDLHINHNPEVTSACVQSLAELLLTNNTLTCIGLQYNRIDSDGIVILMETLKTNKILGKIRLNKYHEQLCSSLPYYDDISKRLDFL